MLDGVARFIARGIAPAEIGFFAHGTTITTNALLEMRGAKVGLLITKGYRAVQEIQTQARDGNLFDYFYAKPAPIAPQSLTREIPERSDYAGNVIVPLDQEAVRQAARELKAAGVESIAVCYLFSFINPRHEAETRAHDRRGAARRARVAVERGAAAHPRMAAALDHAAQRLSRAGDGPLHRPPQRQASTRRRRTPQRFLMQSNGGVMPFSAAIAGGRTVHTLFSGPAAGAQASAHLARDEARRGLVTLDMGGTSADIAFIEGGAPLEVTEGVIARRQVDVPALDMTTISRRRRLDRLDRRRRLPQCRAAERRRRSRPRLLRARRHASRPSPTPTWSAAISTRIISSAARSGSTSRPRGRRCKTHVADPLKMDVLAAAAGIQRIVDMRMADEVRVFAAKRGVDLSAFTLLPFGGAGAVHAAAVAAELGMRRILVPPRPGAFSALGLLCTDVVHDYIRSELRPLAEVAADHAEDIFRQLEAKAREELRAEGMNPADGVFARELDLRYTGQGYELRTPLDGLFAERLTAASLSATREKFDQRHAQIHGHAAKERPVEVVSYRLRVRVAVPKYEPHAQAAAPSPRAVADAVKGRRDISIDGRTVAATIYERDRLDIGAAVAGPAVVEQFDATTVSRRAGAAASTASAIWFWNGRKPDGRVPGVPVRHPFRGETAGHRPMSFSAEQTRKDQ